MKTVNEDSPKTGDWIYGFDLLRVLAISLVLYQHVASNFEYLHLRLNIGHLNAGQLGVALFAALSGYLAVQSHDRMSQWIFRRARKVLPPYWFVLIISIVGNYFVQYKPVSISSIIMQFLGLTYFIADYESLNTATWFVTLIIVAYLTAVPVRAFSRQLARTVMILAIMLATSYMVLSGFQIDFTRQLFVFEAGMLIGEIRKLEYELVFTGILLIMLFSFQHFCFHFLYALVAVAGISFFSHSFSNPIPSPLKAMSTYSYEIFLTHGIFLVFFAKVLDFKMLFSVTMTLIGSAFLAVVIQKSCRTLLQLLTPTEMRS